MLSTSFIVARQPSQSRQEGFSRNSVNSLNTAAYGQETADWSGRGRETVSQNRERRPAKSVQAVSKTRDTVKTGETIKKLGRSMSMSKKVNTYDHTHEKSCAKSGRSVSQTRDPQRQLMSQPTWERNSEERTNESFRNPTITESAEGATRFGYSYVSSMHGTMGGDASSIYAIQSRPLPAPRTVEMEKSKEEKSLYENINRFTSMDRENRRMNRLQSAQVTYARNGTSTLYGTRSKIPVYMPRVEQTMDPRLGPRAVTQMEISRTYEVPPSLDHPISETEDSLVRKGLMWVQQDKLFSRWKERFIILTTGYLQIFKKGATRFSDMGTFINKIKLSCIDSIGLEDKRGYLTLVLTTCYPQEGKLLLRKTEGIKDWHDSVALFCKKEMEKRARLPTDEFWNRKQLSESCGFENWISARDILGNKYNLEDSPCSSIGRPYRTELNELKRAENLYSESQESELINTKTSGLSGASPLSTFSKLQTTTNHSPVRLHQAMFSPPRNFGLIQRERY
eukprot:GFUD01011068.1.p1 GENE.GFUD01011068.1~~GFUD01011068.1.p1  ORF type:complete len:536 (-),score=118.68 GFUD01011068.1:169-1695(-)